ncbi:MAG: 3-isopropylmalate dehydrogenase [Terriglobales bacterium]
MNPKKRVALIPGDGIGKEVIAEAVKVVEASGAAVRFTSFDWGADRYLADRTTVPADGFSMLAREFDAIFAGAFGDPRVASNIHAKEILLGMRSKMDLYANVRPVRLLDAALCPLKGIEPKDVDFVVIRENTEGVYGDLGGVFKQGTADEVAIQEDVNTRKGVERIIRYAFEFCVASKKADGSPRRRVLMCDKSNAMTHAGGLWQRVFKEVGAEYPQIEKQHMYVDALAMQMVRDPRGFDVIVTNNMFGDILTDVAAALQGGLGMAASGNIHPGKTSMFEPVHGSAPPLAGKNVANPFGAILTAAMMLAHLGMTAEAHRIEAVVLEAVRERKTTSDIGGALGTREAGEWVAKRVARGLSFS